MPQLSPFQTCWDRTARAEFHRQSLIKIWDSLKTDDLYASEAQIDHDGTGKFLIRAVHRDWLLPFSLQFGEMLYQLRAALDSCVYDAAILKFGGNNPPPNPQQWNFPVCADAVKFNDLAGRMKNLPDEIRTLLEAVQPYSGAFGRCEGMEWDLGGTLFILNDWARIDRHRRLNLVGTAVTKGHLRFDIPPDSGMGVEYVSATANEFCLIEHSSQVAGFKITNYVPGTKINVHANLALEITVDETPRMRIQDAAMAMGLSISAIRESFERHFGIKR